jgi:hypothetical protein
MLGTSLIPTSHGGAAYRTLGCEVKLVSMLLRALSKEAESLYSLSCREEFFSESGFRQMMFSETQFAAYPVAEKEGVFGNRASGDADSRKFKRLKTPQVACARELEPAPLDTQALPVWRYVLILHCDGGDAQIAL